MEQFDSVHKRLSALAEWLKSNAQETSSVDANPNTLYQNHVTYFYHPYTPTQSNKPQRERTTFKESHIQVLEQSFSAGSHPDSKRREKLALQLGLPAKTIQIWFQNRRARERKGIKGRKNYSDANQSWQSLPEMESNCYFDYNSGLSDFGALTNSALNIHHRPPASELSLATAGDSFENCTATIVQEVDSSKRYEKASSQGETQGHHDQVEKEFTIIHIPDEQAKPFNTSEQSNDYSNSKTDIDIKACQTNDQETAKLSSTEPTEQQFNMSSIENLNLDLVLRTYEVLQSSDNADILIENWLADCSRETEQDVSELTLEENLKLFIQFTQEN